MYKGTKVSTIDSTQRSVIITALRDSYAVRNVPFHNQNILLKSTTEKVMVLFLLNLLKRFLDR